MVRDVGQALSGSVTLRSMQSISFRCPKKNQQVQVTIAVGRSGPGMFETVACPACAQYHLVNIEAGKLLGEKDEKK